jgi:ATP-binding cassette, subfamily B, bacterial
MPEIQDKEHIPRNPIAFSRFVSRPFVGWALGAMAAVLAATVVSFASTYVVKFITDDVVAFGSGALGVDAIWKWAFIFPAIYFVNELIWRMSGFCGMRWITGAVAEANGRLFGYLSEHSANYFSERHAGALVNKISNASSGVEKLAAEWLWQFQPLIVSLAADMYLTHVAHPYFLYALLAWMAIYVPLNVIFVSRLHRLSFAYAESSSLLKGKMVDSTSNVDTVQYTGAIEYEKRHIGRHIGHQRVSHLKEWWYSEWVLVTNGVLLAMFAFAMFALAMHLISISEISVGTLIMVILIVTELEHRMFFLGQHMSQAVSYFGQANEGLKELLEPHEIVDQPNARPLVVRQGEIEFRDLDFSYRGKHVFSGSFDLRIEGGEKVGLVGHSGAGKSTLVALLQRRFDLNGGQILIDGQDISRVTLDSLRQAIAFVPQSTSLFHRSIVENIRYGRLDAGDKEVARAAELAQAESFIRELPDGYDARVGERGVMLSGGQRQRISVARAVLRDAPIQLLDEATSALDSISEAAIQTALVDLMRGKTVIAIAHRLSTLRAMDRVVVMDEGEIVEDGTHDELLELQGVYASLWNSQVSGFIPD